MIRKCFADEVFDHCGDETKSTLLRKNLASAKIVKIELNANLYLLGSPIL